MGESNDANKGLADRTKNRKTSLSKFLPWLIVLVVVAVGLLWFRGMKSSDKVQEQTRVAEIKNKPVIHKKKIKQPIEDPKEVKDAGPEKTLSESGLKHENDPVAVYEPPLSAPSEEPVSVEIPSIEIENYPYSLHMGSYRSLKLTEKHTAELNSKGLSPYWVVVDLDEKGVWHRVFLGHFKTSDEADEFQTEYGIKASRIINTDYAVQIGLYISTEELEQKLSVLRDAGYCPYIIEQAQEQHQLLVGAFQTQKASEELAVRLKDSGIDCEAILR